MQSSGLTPLPYGDAQQVDFTVVAGRGRASTRFQDHAEDVRRILGYDPYPGTMNAISRFPLRLDWSEGKTFMAGKRYLWPARIGEHEVWIYRTIHMPDHVFELASQTRLRAALGLEGGGSGQLEIDQRLVSPLTPLEKTLWLVLWRGREHWYYRYDWCARFSKRLTRMLRRLRLIPKLPGPTAGQKGGSSQHAEDTAKPADML